MPPLLDPHCRSKPARSSLAALLALFLAALLASIECGAAPSVGLTRPPAPGQPSKACIAAGRKVMREQQALDTDQADLAHTSQARKTCATRSACARNDDRIEALNKRIPRHLERLREFEGLRAERCSPAA